RLSANTPAPVRARSAVARPRPIQRLVPPPELVPLPVLGGAGAVVVGVVAVGLGAVAAVTFTVPTMPSSAWSRQMYWYVPALVNVSAKEVPEDVNADES